MNCLALNRKIFFIVFFCWAIGLKAQQGNVPINRFHLLEIDKHLANINNSAHSTVKPYIESFINYDSLVDFEYKSNGFKSYKSLFLRKLKYESLLVVDTTDFKLEIDPLFDFSFYHDTKDQSLRADTSKFYTNTRGVRVKGSITQKLTFETSFFENQAFFVNYLDSFVDKWQVVPGQGRVKDFKIDGFDYAMASGYVSYSPFKQINLQFGHGKNFIGDGYRSLLLSDNAFNYPYLKLTTSLLQNRIQYTNILSSLQTLKRMQTGAPREELFVRKAGSFHYLNVTVHPRVQLGLYEGIVWKNSDGNYPQPVNPMFFNPIIGLNSMLFSGDTVNNVVNGINLKVKVTNKAFVYGQWLVGQMDITKYAYQLGFRWFDLLGVDNLHLQAEFNHVEPFVYAFPNEIQNFAHYNQPLAHPLMANFNELVGFINYRWKDMFVELKGNTALVQRDLGNQNNGNNIFLPIPDVPNVALKKQTKINWASAYVGYVINRKTNMRIKVGVSDRLFDFDGNKQINRIVTLGISTNLSNRYYDF